MSGSWQLGALMKKNLILMKRSWCGTLCEIFFPIILTIFLVLIRRAIKLTDYNEEIIDSDFLRSNSTLLVSPSEFINTTWGGMTFRIPFGICGSRRHIAAIGDQSDNTINTISQRISDYFFLSPGLNLTFMNFSTIDEVNSYITDLNYGLSESKPTLCFGFSYKQLDTNDYNYTLHYFDSELRNAINDIPTTLFGSFDVFQTVPDMKSYTKWINSGYLLMMKIINEIILQKVTDNPNAKLNYAVMAQKYSPYQIDQFGQFIGFVLPFIIIIAYVCPLILMVYRMVKEKETKVKEGMKIMGLKEYIYFLSYFLQWLILNTIYSVINSLILTRVLKYTSFIYILAFFWLFGMTIFSMAYFFQSLFDRTRIAVVISIMVYFIMFFVSQAFLSQDVVNIAKMFISLLPPTALQLGLQIFSQFEKNFVNFGNGQISFSYNNYSVGNMYLMLFIDIFVYLILGYFFDHILSHQYGLRLWCRRKQHEQMEKKILVNNQNAQYVQVEVENKNVSKKSSNNQSSILLLNQNEENFQSEQYYEEKLKRGECLKISNLKKVFDDGKVAVNGLNVNLYNQEIFALLGHNGAGKSTTISILSGLYEATSGSAYYNNVDILKTENMEKFRKKLGICPQHDVLFQNLSVKEHLKIFCYFKGVDSDQIEKEIEKTINEMNLNEIKDELAKNLSGGQKRKLSIAIALIGGSEVVFLDEPTSGMDVTSRRNLWEILKKCVGKRIIVLTTHYMEEAAILGNRIGIVSNGQLKCCGNSLFLIDRLGKYISLDIQPKKDAKPQDIIQFVTDRIPNVVVDPLPEKIMFRIPKHQNQSRGSSKMIINDDESTGLNFKGFFKELDASLEYLRIKSYGLSMPTLEDVFLNVSSENNLNTKKQEDRKFEKLVNTKLETYSWFEKLVIDLKSSLKKRFLQVLRDRKTFLLEVLCPIILVLIGLGLSSVQFIKNSPSLAASLDQIPSGQQIMINRDSFSFDLDQQYNSSFIYSPILINQSQYRQNIIDFNNAILNRNISNSYGSFLILNLDDVNKTYDFVTYPNLLARNAPVIYSQYMINKIISRAAGKNINVYHSISPFPLTNKIRKQGQTRNNSNLVFFFSIAFALIPANFITIIVKERESNTKHLQIVSGISLTSYWLSNYIFELVKYFFIGGINLLLVYAFDLFPPYLWLLYILYGFTMTSFTYLFSLFFETESASQNTVILINFIFGALGGTIIIILRILSDLVEIGKIIAYILRVIPSFAFSYGFNQLLSAQLLYYVDNPNSIQLLNANSYILDLKYAGMDALYLGVEFFFFSLILIMFEKFRNSCRKRRRSSDKVNSTTKINDSIVMQEIEKANRDYDDDKYAVKVKNLEKVYNKGLCKGKTKAVNNLSFCLEAGECFALLGVNGAGKTTTFKTLTCEHFPTQGEIFINGIELTQNFDRIRNLIGYCPQFDAIFDYMTVKENLEFYANIKGIHKDYISSTVSEMINDMNLTQYKDKVSGNLSGGNKRKLSVAIALIGNPAIVLLDEPSTGMDPEARRFMWDVISNISTINKSSSVILTTHSMEEAENLCRRIGIMVDGQFKCLGTSQGIKDKYGYGYEVDLRINFIPEKVLLEYLRISNLDPNSFIRNQSEINETLRLIGKEQFIHLIEKSNFGIQLKEEASTGSGLLVKNLIEWVFYTENFLKLASSILNHYDDVSLIEFYNNNFKLKIKKNSDNARNYTNGFLFSLINDIKSDCFLSEYSISQSSLEQIFNKFALETGQDVVQGNKNKEIIITKEFIRYFNIR